MMRTTREPFSRSWPGPFPDRRELPREPLYDLRIVFRHTANGHAEAALRAAMAESAGEPRVRRWPFRGTTLAWDAHQPPLQAKIHPGEVEVSVGHRIKSSALSRLLEILGRVPGASALTLVGHTRTVQVCDDEGGGEGCCH